LTGSKPNLNYNPDTYLKFDINKIKVEYESDLNKIERNMSEKHFTKFEQDYRIIADQIQEHYNNIHNRFNIFHSNKQKQGQKTKES
jgi:hypothetical protein